MVWLKVSDTAAMHPVVLAPLANPAWPDSALDGMDAVNLIYGLVERCAGHSAGYLTDYVVSDGTVAMMGGPNWRHWAEQAERAGYWARVEIGGQHGWQIMEDSTNFVHIRRKAELEWERQRRQDTSSAGLIIPVRLRDGDGCRYCGAIVNWHDRKSGRGGTYDHRVPKQPAKSPDDLRVACNSCNGARSDHADADIRRPPRPAPTQPFYGAETVALLAKHGHHVPLTQPRQVGNQPARHSDPATSGTPHPSDPAPGGTTHPHNNTHDAGDLQAPATAPHQRPRTRRDHAPAHNRSGSAGSADPADPPPTARHGPPPAPTRPDQHPRRSPPPPKSADPADHRHAGSGSPGRERDGHGSGAPPPMTRSSSPRPTRGRRGRPR